MDFSKIEGFFRFSGFSSLLRPILPAAFDRAGNFTRKMYFWIFFWSFWGLLHQKQTTPLFTTPSEIIQHQLRSLKISFL